MKLTKILKCVLNEVQSNLKLEPWRHDKTGQPIDSAHKNMIVNNYSDYSEKIIPTKYHQYLSTAGHGQITTNSPYQFQPNYLYTSIKFKSITGTAAIEFLNYLQSKGYKKQKATAGYEDSMVKMINKKTNHIILLTKSNTGLADN